MAGPSERREIPRQSVQSYVSIARHCAVLLTFGRRLTVSWRCSRVPACFSLEVVVMHVCFRVLLSRVPVVARENVSQRLSLSVLADALAGNGQ